MTKTGSLNLCVGYHFNAFLKGIIHNWRHAEGVGGSVFLGVGLFVKQVLLSMTEGGGGKKNMRDVIYECAVNRQMQTSIRVKPLSGKKLSDSMNFIWILFFYGSPIHCECIAFNLNDGLI